MELYQLEYFLEAARQRNFTRAAAHLHLAQAALSEQMRKLESELGASLFSRGRRETVLTAAGLGIAILPRFATCEAAANCIALRLRGDPVERQVAVLSRAGHTPSPGAAGFRKILSGCK